MRSAASAIGLGPRTADAFADSAWRASANGLSLRLGNVARRPCQSPSVSLIFPASAAIVKGFWIKGTRASTIPRCATTSAV